MMTSLVASLLLTTLLIYSSIAKLLTYQDFKITIKQLRFPAYFARFVNAIEGLIALLLLLDFTRPIGLGAALLLFLSIYGVAGWSIYRRLDITCNCFGKSSDEKLGWGTIWKAAPFLLLSAFGLLTYQAVELTSMSLTEIIGCAGLTIGALNIYFLLKNRKTLLGG